MYIDRKTACYLLSCAGDIGPASIGRLRLTAGSYQDMILTDPDLFLNSGIINKKQAERLHRVRSDMDRLLLKYEELTASGVSIFTLEDSGYPERLAKISDPPFILYVRGRLPDDDMPSAAVIGSRTCSDYGISAAEFFSEELSENGVQIISGLAHGIDTAAAVGALRSGHDTFAVLGTGINICYPKENYPLYRSITGEAEGTHNRGGVITEFAPDENALPFHFIMRNRIIAGLCDVLLVIEAREKSGTSITVNYALSQGKDVFAMPGRINDPLGRGCNDLIHDGAYPLTEPGDVLTYLGIDSSEKNIMGKRDTACLSHDEKNIYSVLTEEPSHLEDISEASGIPILKLPMILFDLEQKGYALNTGNAFYKRL